MSDVGFVLKKFITFFIEPLGLVLTLFVLGLFFLYMKKNRFAKVSLSASLGFLLLFSYPPFSNFLVKNLEDIYPKYTSSKDITYIHVLGSGHNTDDAQPISSNIGDAGTKRVLEGVFIHKNIPNSKLIFTGYAGSTDTPNAVMNARLAVALGVDEKNIIIEPNPKDTREEAEFTRTLLKDKEEFVLVTSASHMPRSMMLFESLGLNPIAAPTAYRQYEFNGYMKAPKISSFLTSKIAMHEYFGILWSKIKG